MFSGYCGVPCRQLPLADACVQKGETPDRSPRFLFVFGIHRLRELLQEAE